MRNLEVFNRALFLNIDAGAGTAPWFIDLAVIIANDIVYLIPVLLCAMWMWGGDARRRVVVRACLTALLALGLNQIIAALWQHPRPFAIGLAREWVPHVADSSFPSDHMSVFTAVGLGLVLGREALLGWLILAVGIAVAWARVFLGLHFPFDMLGAVGVACLSYAVLSPPWRYGGERLTRFVEMFYRNVMAHPIAQGWIRR